MTESHSKGAEVENTDQVDCAFEDEPEPKGPERKCVATGQILPKTQLLRFVISPDQEIVVDVAQRLPGRGIWLYPSRDVVNTAVSKKIFAKVARRQVKVPADLAEKIEALLVGRCLSTLGMARRAGRAIAGHEKVRAEILAGRAGLVLVASDGAEDGVKRMRSLATGLPVVAVLNSQELGGVFGREATVHGVISRGDFAKGLVEQAAFLSGFR
jgi:uncharacterized protein